MNKNFTVEYKIENFADYINALKQKEFYINLAKNINEQANEKLDILLNMSTVILTNDLINNAIISKLTNLINQYKDKRVKKAIKKFVEFYPNFKRCFESAPNFKVFVNERLDEEYIFNDWVEELKLLNKLSKNCSFKNISELNKTKVLNFCVANQNQYAMLEKSLEKIEFLVQELDSTIKSILL